MKNGPIIWVCGNGEVTICDGCGSLLSKFYVYGYEEDL